MKKKKFTDTPSFLACLFLFLPIFLLEPLSVSLVLVSTMLIHESGHLFAFFLTSSEMPSLTVGPFGLLLTPKRPLSYKSELTVALFGPLFNILSAIFLLFFGLRGGGAMLFIFLNFAIAFYNLLPISFLDGGRILFSVSALLFSLECAERIRKIASFSCFSLLLFFSLWLILIYDIGYGIFFTSCLLLAFSAKNQR